MNDYCKTGIYVVFGKQKKKEKENRKQDDSMIFRTKSLRLLN